MKDSPSTGFKPTRRTGRTVSLFKSRVSKSNASFSSINPFRPMALNARRAQPIASDLADAGASILNDGEHLDHEGGMRKASTTTIEDDVAAGPHQNPIINSTPKVPFINRKLNRSRSHRATSGSQVDAAPTASASLLSSQDQSGTAGVKASKSWATSLRARTVSSKSGSTHSQEELPAGTSLAGLSLQGTKVRSEDSLESGVSNQRVVGRGGSGSRPRVVVTEELPTFNIPTRNASLSPPEQQPALRPSGRGGFASRPQALAPPPPLPAALAKSPLSSEKVNQVPPSNDVAPERPVFVRPGGRGGAGSRPKIKSKSPTGANSTSSQSSSLLARIQKRKLKSQLQRQQQPPNGEPSAPPYGVHPVRDSLAYKIMNGSTSTLSTIQFSGEPQPRPHFFPDDDSIHDDSVRTHISLTSLASDDMAWTPTNTFSSTNSDCISSTSVNETPDDESQLDAYYIEGDEDLQETRPTTPTYHHQRTLDKLTQTFGETPTILFGPRDQPRPKLAVKTTTPASPSRPGKAKGVRRTSISLSVSSIFMRHQRRPSSVSTISSTSEEIHFSNRSRLSEAPSESWGLARDSYSTTPGSPMIFSSPSPTSLQRKRRSQLASPNEDLEEADEDHSVDIPVMSLEERPDSDASELPSPNLSRSQSVRLDSGSRQRSTWRASHAQSASMSALDAVTVPMHDEPLGVAQASPLKVHPDWIFPPDDYSDHSDRSTPAFSTMRKRQRHETMVMASDEQGWTGEWNSDLQDVIRSLRALH